MNLKNKIMENTERHHCIPISLLGPDIVENLISVTIEEHKVIHKTLNIPYNLIRRFRKKTNHLVLDPNEFFVKELRLIHLSYFDKINFKKLPQHLRNAHLRSMESIVAREIHLNGFNQKIPYDVGKTFWEYLNTYHNIMVLRVRNKKRKET